MELFKGPTRHFNHTVIDGGFKRGEGFSSDIIGDFIQSPAGRAKLAASMTQPLRTRRDYAAVGRKTFLVEELPDGELPIYDKDPDVTAYVVGEEGQNIVGITKPRRV